MSKDGMSSAMPVAAELWASLGGDEPREGLSLALLAVYLDGGLQGELRTEVLRRLAASPADFHNSLSGVVYLESLTTETVPRDLVSATLVPSANHNLTPLRPRASPRVERFALLAAASETDSHAVLCRSQSGIWTLEVFVSAGNAEKGYLLLSVHPDHRNTYEGREARVFTQMGDEERVLAEQVVQNGEVYCPISLAGLDLRRRDAINVMFGPPPL